MVYCMFIRRNAAKSEENIHLDLTIIFPIKIQVVFVNIMVKAPMYKALLYTLRESDEFLDYVLSTVIDFSIFTGRLLNMGRVLVISLVMGLIVFSQLHERFVSTRDQCTFNNCQLSTKQPKVHSRPQRPRSFWSVTEIATSG